MAHQIRACCLTGHIATGTPKGEMKVLGGLNTYVATPSADKAQEGCAIVMLADIFGLNKNPKLIADSFAEQAGIMCVVPDLFNGRPMPEWVMEGFLFVSDIGVELPTTCMGRVWRLLQKICFVLSAVPTIVSFFVRHPPLSKPRIVQGVVKDLREQHGVSRVGLVGYCYGGMLGVAMGQKEGACQAIAVAHCDFKVPKDLAALKVPGLFIFADRDWTMQERKREAAIAFLQTRTDHTYRFKYYPGTFHGFAARGDERLPEVLAAKEDAFQEMARFFLDTIAQA